MVFFLVCENNFEWCRVHWEGVKGTHHHLIFLHRKLVYFRDVIVLHAEKQSTSWVFLVQSDGNFQIVLKERIFLRQEHVPSTMHVPAENSAWLCLANIIYMIGPGVWVSIIVRSC